MLALTPIVMSIGVLFLIAILILAFVYGHHRTNKQTTTTAAKRPAAETPLPHAVGTSTTRAVGKET